MTFGYFQASKLQKCQLIQIRWYIAAGSYYFLSALQVAIKERT